MGSFYRFARAALPISLLLLAAVAVPLKILDSEGLERVERLDRELEDLEASNRQLERENDALRREIHAFHSDPRYVEKIARDELGMVGPDEIIYQFPYE